MVTIADERLLTVEEVAKHLRLTRDSIYRRIQSGELRAVRLGEHGPLRISADALAAYLEAGRPPIEGAS